MTAEPTPLTELVRHVLVPLDGSEFALQALPTARALADRLGAQMHTISVVEEGEDPGRLRTLASAAVGVDVGDDRVTVVSGTDPAVAIAARADELDTCVVCLSTQGRGRLHGAVVGSVARSVLQAAQRPVVALGPSADNPGWSPRPRSWPEPLSVPRIIACVDGSPSSEQIVPVVATWARGLDMSMTILTVTDDGPEPIRPERQRTRYGSHAHPTSYVDELVERWRGSVPEIDGHVERDPISPASGIRHHLDGRPAGLLAVSSHARSGMQRALLGATAATMVRASVVPCLVARVSA